MDKEIWKDITGYEGLYQASTSGKIKSLQNNFKIKRNLILKCKIDKDGYEQVTLMKNGKCKYFMVHRLVALTFIPNTLNKPEVNHIDKIRNNNKFNNLEWVTRKENVRHCNKDKMIYKSISQYDLDMNFIKKWDYISDIKKEYNLKSFSIGYNFNKYTNKILDYYWEYNK